MGNKLGRKRQVVDEKYTRPQGLYQHKYVDHKKLRKLILESKLAPCYPGDDDCRGCDLEECPICFLYYPSLNRSRCCMKGICTECFLQMKMPNSTQPTQCPFCKTPSYAVEYRGIKTKEEKGLEQLEEQRVIEAKIKMRQKELQDEEERIWKKRAMDSSSSMKGSAEVEFCSTRVPYVVSALEREETVGLHESSATLASRARLSPRPRQNRDVEFNLDIEDIMVMEAIWLSIQENDRHQDPPCSDVPQSAECTVQNWCSLAATDPVAASSSASPSTGLSCAIAALTEQQPMAGEIPSNYSRDMLTYMSSCSRYPNREEQESESYLSAESANGVSPGSAVTGNTGDWADHGSVVAEVGSSCGGSDGFSDAGGPTALPQQGENVRGLPVVTSAVPESDDDQMMLAMAISLAEARVRTSHPGVSWH